MKKLIVLLLLSSTSLLMADGPFLDLSFDKGLAKAKKEDKVLFVDFYTDWCGPCKLLNRTTFKDAKVIKMLSEEVVALKINAEVEVKLAKRFGIAGYPSLVFINNDGTLRENLMGYRDANTFLKDAANVLEGKTELLKLADAHAADPTNKKTFYTYVHKLCEAKNYKKAFELIKPVLDDLANREPKGPDRQSYVVLSRIQSDAAKAYVKKALEEVGKTIRSGDFEKHHFKHFANLAYATRVPDAPVKLFDEIKENLNEDQRTMTGKLILGDLRQLGRYEEIESIEPVAQAIEEVFTFHNELNEKYGRDAAYPFLRSKTGPHYQTFLGLNRINEANSYADRILAIYKTPDIYNQLAWAGYLADTNHKRNLEFAKAGLDLIPDSHEVFYTYAKLMEKNGMQDQALKLSKERLTTTQSGTLGHNIITTLLKELTGN